VVIAVGYPPSALHGWFTEVREVARTATPYGLDNDEAGEPVFVCRGIREAWAELWPGMARTG